MHEFESAKIHVPFMLTGVKQKSGNAQACDIIQLEKESIMSQRNLLLSFVTTGLILVSGSTFAVDTPAEPVFGSQLMTEQERVEHRNAMRTARTDEERAKVRSTHHDQMVLRAQERGVTLPAVAPEQPPRRGMGPGMNGGGQGVGQGMGPGQGMGGGRGRQ